MSCSKLVELISEDVPGGAKGLEKFATRLIDHAGRMVEHHGLRAIAIMVNRVNTARKVHEICRKRWTESKADTICLTGRMRPFDRDEIVGQWKPRLRPDTNRPPREKPVFVIATQCLEVGANLDFEGMVTECASLDALRQRFGRLKRLGHGPEARGVILIRADGVKTEDELVKEPPAKKDPIYDDALPRTWNWLWDHATPASCEDGKEQRVIDFGIAALDRILPTNPGGYEPLQAPSGDAPIMLPSHVDCWVQTRPQPFPDPDVSLFLHGPDRGEGEVRVCWRADLNINLPDDSRGERWRDAVAFCPPTAAECMSVPIRVARDWFRQDPMAAPPDDNSSDLEHAATLETPTRDENSISQRQILRGADPTILPRNC